MLVAESKDLIKLKYSSQSINRLNQASKSNYWGNQKSKKKGSGIEFNQARPYAQGDDVRTIDWRITARKQVTHTREFHQDHEQNIFLLTDISTSMRFASTTRLKSVQAAYISATIGWSGLQNKYRVGGIVHCDNNKILKPTLNQKRFCYWLGQLSQATHDLINQNNVTQTQWIENIQRCQRLISSGSRLFIIGELFSLTESCWSFLSHMAKNNQIHLIHVYDTLEQHISTSKEINLYDGQQNYRYNHSPKKQQQLYQSMIDELEKKTKSIGGQLVQCSTADDVSALLLKNNLLTH